MALITTPIFYYPQLPVSTDLPPVPSDATFNLNTDDTREWIIPFIVQKAGTIDEVAFLTGDDFTLNAASVLRISLQDMVAVPGFFNDGTADQYRDIDDSVWTGANTWISSGLLTDDGTDGGIKRTVSYGDRLCIVIKHQTFTSGDSLSIAVIPTDAEESGIQRAMFGHLWYYSGSSHLLNSGYPCLALKYADGSYAPIQPYIFPAKAGGTTSLSGNVEAGLKFSPPFNMRVIGAYGSVGNEEDIRFLLYDNAETLLASSGQDVQQSSADDGLFSYFGDRVTLTANETYYLVVRREGDKATNGELHYIDVDSAQILGGISGGSSYHYAARTDYTTDSFAATTTRRPWLALVLDGYDPDGAAPPPQNVTPSVVSVSTAVQAPGTTSPQIVTAPRQVAISLTVPVISNSKPIPDTVAVTLSLPVPIASITGKKLFPQPVNISALVQTPEAFLGARVHPEPLDVPISTVQPALQSDALQTVTPDVLTISIFPQGVKTPIDALIMFNLYDQNSPALATDPYTWFVSKVCVELPFPTIVQAAAIPSQEPPVKAVVWIVQLTLDDGSGGVSVVSVPAESISATQEWLGTSYFDRDKPGVSASIVRRQEPFAKIGQGSISLSIKLPGLAALELSNQAYADALADSSLLTRPGLVRVFRETQFHGSDLTWTDGPFLSALINNVTFRRELNGYSVDMGAVRNLTQAEGSYKTHLLSTQDLTNYDGGAGQAFEATIPIVGSRFIMPRDYLQIAGLFTVRINSVTTSLSAGQAMQTVSSVEEVPF